MVHMVHDVPTHCLLKCLEGTSEPWTTMQQMLLLDGFEAIAGAIGFFMAVCSFAGVNTDGSSGSTTG